VPKILAAVLAAFWAAASAAGAEARLDQPSVTVLEVTGGTGQHAWRLRYGTLPQWTTITGIKVVGAQLVQIDKSHAYFSHGGWLRLIDTEKGVVIGRWRFPGQIASILLEGNRTQIALDQLELGLGEDRPLRVTLSFDPAAPPAPYWPIGWLGLYRLPETEVLSAFRVGPPVGVSGAKTPPEQARESIPDLQEQVAHDPCSPWARVYLGKLLRDAGDPRASTVLREAVQVPTTDFTELLPISAFLDQIGERDIAREAFERGYRDYLERGNDPRLQISLLGMLVTYHVQAWTTSNAASEYSQEIVERIYRLCPNAEGAPFAWQLYADYWQKAGKANLAQVWRARAEEARRNSLSFASPGTGDVADRALLVVFASILSVIVYVLVLHARYGPQRRFDRAAKKRPSGFWQVWGFRLAGYWSRRERVAFLSIVLAGWFAMGVAGQYVQTMLRIASSPISMGMGSYAGPETSRFLDRSLPATPERDLLRAFSYQQSGENKMAEPLYRSLPNFAESWNNLGVILKTAGKKQEARQAFERALRLDPSLAEAALNLGRPSQSYWTDLHQKYLPGRPMLAPPKGGRILHAFFGGSFVDVWLRALLGPLSGVFSAIGKLVG